MKNRPAKVSRIKGSSDGKTVDFHEAVSQSAVRIVDTLKQAGYEAYIVGGAVRDLFLGITPKDYDLATNATPEQVKEVFGRRARLIGRRFRLVHVYMGRSVYEVSTFRREPNTEERKSRPTDDGVIVWRDNVYGTLEDDARRRDFTVNALYYDPTSPADGIVDYCGGLDDLREGKVRTIGDPATRLAEDPVRMLRACKLVGQYGFTNTEVRTPLIEGAENLALASSVRLLEEIYKILKKPYSSSTFAACHDVGLLQYLLPELGKEWDQPLGQMARNILDVRDQRMAEGDLYPSRVTGLAMIMLPYVQSELGDDKGPLWRNFGGIDRVLSERIREFYHPYGMPRYSRAKILDVLVLQPKFLQPRMRRRLMAHPEYKRARDVFDVYAAATNLEVPV